MAGQWAMIEEVTEAMFWELPSARHVYPAPPSFYRKIIAGHVEWLWRYFEIDRDISSLHGQLEHVRDVIPCRGKTI
jgi:hypothetical protein